jgi:hypothetical protein
MTRSDLAASRPAPASASGPTTRHSLPTRFGFAPAETGPTPKLVHVGGVVAMGAAWFR